MPVVVRSRWRRRWRRWWRASPARWWAAVAVLAVVTLVVVRGGLAASAGVAARWGAERPVPVVVAPVAAGAVVGPGDVVVEARPAATVPTGDDVAVAWEGRTARVPLVAGEVVLASKLAPDGLRGAAALLPDGARALSVPGGPGGRPPVQVGDAVDLLVTLADTGESFVVAASALVLHVDREADAVTVAVPAADAPAVASAIATGAVTLALTGPGRPR